MGKNGKPDCIEMREHMIVSPDLKIRYKTYTYIFYRMIGKILK